jgi:predicted RNase H-like HicB family nuclease
MNTLSKRELKKVAYQMIFKEGKSHQEAFDNLRETKSIAPDDLAELIGKIPSRQKLKEQSALNYTYVGLLCVIIVLRGLSLIGMGSR